MNNIRSENNSYNAIRLAAAFLVLYSHHFALYGLKEPFVPFVRNTFGGFAVSTFFAVSGFLVFRSACRSSSAISFFSARFLRIFPALCVCTIISSIIMMIVFFNYENYSLHVKYIIHNSFSFMQPVIYGIKGVLDGRPNTSINGSLWSLQYEFFFYIIAFISAIIIRGRFLFVILVSSIMFFLYKTIYVKSISILSFNLSAKLVYLYGMHFVGGMFVYIFSPLIFRRKKLSLFISILIIIASKVAFGERSMVFIVSTAVAIIIICESKVLSFWSRMGDPSYGVYLYAFPIQQLCIIFVGDFWISILASSILTLIAGFTSWHFLEKKALLAKKPLSDFLQKSIIPPSTKTT